MNENDSYTDIANSALAQIGCDTIASIEDDNDGNAKAIRILIDQTAKEVQSHSSSCWEELLREEKLTLRGVREYNLPLNYLSVDCVFSPSMRKLPWSVVGGFLRTNEDASLIRYVRFSDNPGEWSVELKSCVIELLAAKLIASIVKEFLASRKLVEQFWQVSFPRWAGNRQQNSYRAKSGYDGELRGLYPNGGSESSVLSTE